MRRILKWRVGVDDCTHAIGTGPVVLVSAQGADPTQVFVWTEEPAETDPMLRDVRVYGTGHVIPGDLIHLGSAVMSTLPYVWHVYEVPPA